MNTPSRDDLKQWIKWYNLEEYLFKDVSTKFKQRHSLIESDFFAIVIWKSNRSKTKVKAGLRATGKTAEQLMGEVWQASKPEDKVNLLVEINGIGIPIASAILAVCYPEDFTILDYRALNSFYDLWKDRYPNRPYTIRGYLEYCKTCKKIADQYRICLRDLDRVLWGRSWEQGLETLIEKE